MPRRAPSLPGARPAIVGLAALATTVALSALVARPAASATGTRAAVDVARPADRRPAGDGAVDADRSWLTAKALRATHPTLPDPEERLALGELYRALLTAAPAGRVPAEAAERAAGLGLRLHRAGDVVWLREGTTPLRGTGLVAIRLGALDAEVVIQAPHPFHDSDTGAIVGRLFDDAARADAAPDDPPIRAIFLATAARDARADGDPTDATAHPLQVFSDAVDRSLVHPLVVQIHGFAPQTTPADAVVSVGRSQSGGDLEDRARIALARRLRLADVRGPEQVPRLAAGTNVQGRLLAERARFLHLELSATQRRLLRTRRSSRVALRATLHDLARGVQP